MGDAASDFLPGGGFLRTQQFGEVVEHEHVAGVSAARTKGADGHGQMQNSPANHSFNFARDHAHAQGAAHQVLHRASGFAAEQFVERLFVARAVTEHAADSAIAAQDRSAGIERNHAGGNILEHGFHQLAATLELLHGLLKISGELINLRAVVAQLRGHIVEGADQDAKLVLSLVGHLIFKIAGGNFAGAFREGLNGYGDLFGEKQGHPHHRKHHQHGEEQKDEQHLALEGAEILFFEVVLGGLFLDFVEARKKCRIAAEGGDYETRRRPILQ